MKTERQLKNKISLFIDSGAHTLLKLHTHNKKHEEQFTFFKTKEFWDYVDGYAEWIHKNIKVIDIYANVDVILNAEASWEVYDYMRKTHGLNPMPVFHFGEDIKWLKKYMDCTDYIAVGGVALGVSTRKYWERDVGFADNVFTTICDSSGMPQYKIHGFAVTSFPVMKLYPWYSVDSTTWVQYSRNGVICVPRCKAGEYVHDDRPWILAVSDKSPKKSDKGKHISTLSPEAREVIINYLTLKGFTLEEVAEDYKKRDELNIIYFLDFEKTLPKWPWRFKRLNDKRTLI